MTDEPARTTEEINRILEDELAKIGGAAGAIGGAIGGDGFAEGAAGWVGAAFGGARGARIAARRLGNDTFEQTVELEAGPAEALVVIGAALGRVGRVPGGDPARPNPSLRALVSAGVLNMNPAVVDVEIVPLDAGRCRVVIRGTAKEGLIKQRAGEKAVGRVLEAIGLV